MDETLLKKMVDDSLMDAWLVAADYLEDNGLDKRARHMRKRYSRVKELTAVLHSVNLSQKLPVNTLPVLKEFSLGYLQVRGNEFKLWLWFYRRIGYIRTYRYTDKRNRTVENRCVFELDRSRMTADQNYTQMMATFIVDKMYPIKK